MTIKTKNSRYINCSEVLLSFRLLKLYHGPRKRDTKLPSLASDHTVNVNKNPANCTYNFFSMKNPSQSKYFEMFLKPSQNAWGCFGNPLQAPSNIFHISYGHFPPKGRLEIVHTRWRRYGNCFENYREKHCKRFVLHTSARAIVGSIDDSKYAIFRMSPLPIPPPLL